MRVIDPQSSTRSECAPIILAHWIPLCAARKKAWTGGDGTLMLGQRIGYLLKRQLLARRAGTLAPCGSTSASQPKLLTTFQELHKSTLQSANGNNNNSNRNQRNQRNDKNDIKTPGNETNIGIGMLFKNRSTRAPVLKLLAMMSVLQVVVFYVSSTTLVDELEDTEDKITQLWNMYEHRDISQAVMAIHIGQLKDQLIKAGVQPIDSQQAMKLAQHLITFERDADLGNLLIFVDTKSKLYPLVPFSTEYDISKVSKFRHAITDPWDTYQRRPSSTDDSQDSSQDSTPNNGSSP